MGRLSEAGAFLRTLRADGSLPSYFPACALWKVFRTNLNFRITALRPRDRTTVWMCTFSALHFPVVCSLRRFRLFASGWLAGAFRAHKFLCLAQIL